MRHDEKHRELEVIEEVWIKKDGFQHRGLINHVPANRFINPWGPPLIKLQKKIRAEGVD
jgi:hypothetical protein